MENFIDLVNSNKDTITTQKAKDYNLLSFAFVGDAVHTLFVRTHLTANSTAQAGILHTLTNGFVRAEAQAKVLDELIGELTEEEANIARRARNLKSKTAAKNASLADYKKATSFEAVIGYLYITNQVKRMTDLLTKSVEIMERK